MNVRPPRAFNTGGPPADVLSRVVLVAMGGLATLLMGLMLWPFLPALATAAALAMLVPPRLRARTRRRSVVSFLATAAIFLLILLPAAGLGIVIGNEIAEAMQWLSREGPSLLHRRESAFSRWIAPAANALGLDPDAVLTAGSQELELLARTLPGRAIGVLSGLGGWLFQGGIALFTLYYLLKDGDDIVLAIERVFPFEEAQADRLLARSAEVMRATIYGNVLVALVQGTLGGIAFAVLGIGGAALWGALMAVLSLLPVIGPVVVWVPAVIILLLSGRTVAALLLLAWGALVVSTVDNILRAILVGGRAQMHPLVVFFSVIGGIVVFGAAGILLGPVVFVAAYLVIVMARESLGPSEPYPSSSA